MLKTQFSPMSSTLVVILLLKPSESSGPTPQSPAFTWNLVFSKIRKHWPLITSLWLALTFGIGLWADLSGLGLLDFLEPKGRMNGTFNIAVAEFESTDEGFSKDSAAHLSASVLGSIEALFQKTSPGFDVLVWGPDRVGQIIGPTSLARARTASELADQLGADLLIYADITKDRDEWLLYPKLVVTGKVPLVIEQWMKPVDVKVPTVSYSYAKNRL